ncbi:NAD(P)/FAD-dependent oxidoreductase, partial [Escherichia coli]|nr:NAD(P)/FAD-dependent oxidoreductase [Escherichia coli]
ELYRIGRNEVTGYGGTVRPGRVQSVQQEPSGGFSATLSDGTAATARRIILAVGLVDELPEIPGLREHWGRTVLHCPYCHGWEVRDQQIGIIGTGPFSVHQALLF